MKKVSIIILSVILVLSLFAACGEKGDTNKDVNNTTLAAQDVAFNCTNSVASKTKAKEIVNAGTLELTEAYENSVEVAKVADYVIKGKVKETEYVLDGSTVFTKSTVVVENSIKGALKEGDEIYVKELGGFVESDVYANAISVEKYGEEVEVGNNSEILDLRVDGYKVMEKDETVVLFLVKTTGSELEAFQNNTYEPVRAWQGKLLYHEEISAYAPYIPENEKELIKAETYKESELSIFANS